MLDASRVRLLCGYSQDGRSMEKDCETTGGAGGCVPGCTPRTQWCVDTRCLNLRYEKECALRRQRRRSACLLDAARDHGTSTAAANLLALPHRVYRCAWAPNQLQQLLAKQDTCNPYAHNEIVIDPQSLVAALPGSVLGIFYQRGSTADQRQQAIRAHSLFLADYRLDAAAFPLMVYDNGKEHGVLPSFSTAPRERPCDTAPLLPGQTHPRCQESG